MGKPRAARDEEATSFGKRPSRPAQLRVALGLSVIAAAIYAWTFVPREREQPRRAAGSSALDASAASAPLSEAVHKRPSQLGAVHSAPETVAAADSTASVSEVAARNVRELAAVLREQFAKQFDYDAYRECMEQGGACTDELSRLLYMASAELQDHIFDDAFDIGALVAAHGARAVEQALIEDLRSTRDPVERYAALHLLSDWESGVEPVELPADLYQNLEKRPMAEAQLLLMRHQRTPVTNPETRDRLTELGAQSGTDPRMWSSIFHALGHEETAAELKHVVTSRPLDSVTSLDAAGPAARCGLACLDTLKAIAAQGQDGRTAVLRSLQGLDPADVSSALAALAPGHPQSDEERSLLSELSNERDRP